MGRSKQVGESPFVDPVGAGLPEVQRAPDEERRGLALALLKKATAVTRVAAFRDVHALAFVGHDVSALDAVAELTLGGGCGSAYACLHVKAGAIVLKALVGSVSLIDPVMYCGEISVYEGELKIITGAAGDPDRKRHLLLLAILCSDINHGWEHLSLAWWRTCAQASGRRQTL